MPFEQLPDTAVVEEMALVRHGIAHEYRRQKPEDKEIRDDLVHVNPMKLCGYEVLLEFQGQTIVVAKREPANPPAPIDIVGKRLFSSKPITNQPLLAALPNATPDKVVIFFRGFYEWQDVVVTSVSVVAVQRSLAKVHEAVPGTPGDFNLASTVTRDAREDVKRLVSTEIKTIIEREEKSDPDLVANLTNRALNAMDKYFADLRPLSLAEIDKSVNSFIIWTTDFARLELQPDEFRKLTTSLETSETFEKEWKRAYDLLTVCEKEFTDYRGACPLPSGAGIGGRLGRRRTETIEVGLGREKGPSLISTV